VYWGALRQRSGAGEGVVEEEDVVEAVESPAHGSERPRVGSKRKRPASKKIAYFCSTGASVATSPTLTTELQPETRSPASMDTDALVVFDEMPPSKILIGIAGLWIVFLVLACNRNITQIINETLFHSTFLSFIKILYINLTRAHQGSFLEI
jgi:hypothetical protein